VIDETVVNELADDVAPGWLSSDGSKYQLEVKDEWEG